MMIDHKWRHDELLYTMSINDTQYTIKNYMLLNYCYVSFYKLIY